MRVRVAGICGLSVTSQQQKRGHAPPFPIRDSCRACKPNSVCRSFSPTDSLPPKEGGRTGHPPPLNAGGDKERHGDHSSRPYIAARLQRPTRKLWRTEPARSRRSFRSTHHCAEPKERRDPPLFGLAPCGVFPATAIAGGAVRSYRTFSPLPRLRGAVCFLWHSPSTPLERRRPDVIRHTTLWSSDFPLPARAT